MQLLIHSLFLCMCSSLNHSLTWNCHWLQEEAAKWGQHPVICSGSIFGTKVGVAAFETRLLKEVSKKRCHERFIESDQGE